MKAKTIIICAALSVFIIGLTASAWAVDMDAMKKKVETVKGQAESVKKEGGEVKQDVKDMKAQDAMKNAEETKTEGMKLKDTVTGK
jgi:outer membrane lipoprotein-sorting protein